MRTQPTYAVSMFTETSIKRSRSQIVTLKIVGDFGIELVALQYYTTPMMRRRTLRIIAYVLMFIIGTVAVEGFDVLSGGNITEQLFEPIRRGCFG